MSQPPFPAGLRAPARWDQAVRSELVVLREAHVLRWGWLILLLAISGMSVSGGSGDAPFTEVRFLVPLMFFFPLAWQREGGSPRRKAPLPMADLTLELIRLACGALCAALLLGLCVRGYTAALGLRQDLSGTVGGFPAWYPTALCLVGLAHYLFGAAVMLLAARPGRVLVVVFWLGLMAVLLSGIGLETVTYRMEYGTDGTLRWVGSTSLTMGAALLRLAGGCGAVALAVLAVRVRGRFRWSLPHLPQHRTTLRGGRKAFARHGAAPAPEGGIADDDRGTAARAACAADGVAATGGRGDRGTAGGNGAVGGRGRPGLSGRSVVCLRLCGVLLAGAGLDG